MNDLLTLAEDLEQRLRAQQQSTGEMLKAAFSKREKFVGAELNESERRISAAVLDHDRKLSSAMSQRMRGMLRVVSQTWLAIVLISVLLVVSGAGILWWQGQQILDNCTGIREQKDALEKLNTQAWDVGYQEDNQGRSLMLPEGVKTDTNWTFDGGRKNGIGLVQEQSSITELEKQLLSALEQLQQDCSKRLDRWENVLTERRTMSGLIQRENAALSKRVTGLGRQVRSLSEQLCRLSQS